MIFARKCNHLFIFFLLYFLFLIWHIFFLYQNLSNENCSLIFYINDTWYRKYNQWMNTKLISCCLQPSVSLSSSQFWWCYGTFNCNSSNKTQTLSLYKWFFNLDFLQLSHWCSKHVMSFFQSKHLVINW